MKYIFILLIVCMSFSSAQFISPVKNQTYNTTDIYLDYNLTDYTDFYYVVNNNTDGSERVYPNENLSALFEAVEGENNITAYFEVDGYLYFETITFYINTTIVNETNETIIIPIVQSHGHHKKRNVTCEYVINCSEWSECFESGTQYRSCKVSCGIMPNVTQSCNYVAPVKENKWENTTVEIFTNETDMCEECIDEYGNTSRCDHFCGVEQKEDNYWWIGLVIFVIFFFIILKFFSDKDTPDELPEFKEVMNENH